MDRARRSIKNENRQSNVVDLISAFGDIPKKSHIKFDVCPVAAAPEDDDEADEDGFNLAKYQRSAFDSDFFPVEIDQEVAIGRVQQ